MRKIITDASFGSPKMDAIIATMRDLGTTSKFENNKRTATPLSFEAFLPAIQGKIKQINAYWQTKETKEEAIFVSIQEGFFKKEDVWHISAIAGIFHKDKLHAAIAEPFHLHAVTDRIMALPEQERYVQFEKAYPDFRTRSFAEILSLGATTEKVWFETILKKCKDSLSI